MIGNNKTNFPHKLLLTDRQVSSLCKFFASHSSADIKLSKTHLSKMKQSGEFLCRLLGPLLKTGLPLIKNVIKALAKSILILLGLIEATPAAGAGIHTKNLRIKEYNTNNIKDEIDDIIKIIKSLEYSGSLLKRVTETVQNEVKEQKGGFLNMLLGTLGAFYQEIF